MLIRSTLRRRTISRRQHFVRRMSPRAAKVYQAAREFEVLTRGLVLYYAPPTTEIAAVQSSSGLCIGTDDVVHCAPTKPAGIPAPLESADVYALLRGCVLQAYVNTTFRLDQHAVCLLQHVLATGCNLLEALGHPGQRIAHDSHGHLLPYTDPRPSTKRYIVWSSLSVPPWTTVSTCTS